MQRNAMQCNAASPVTRSHSSWATRSVNRHLTHVLGEKLVPRNPREAPIPQSLVPSLQKKSLSLQKRQMDVAPPRPPRLPRSGLACSDPWLPNGLRGAMSPPPLSAANRAPASGSSRGETSLVCGMCIPIHCYCTVLVLYATTFAGQFWAVLWYTPKVLRAACSRPHPAGAGAATFCLVLFPILSITTIGSTRNL